jgi:hypothetical protein
MPPAVGTASSTRSPSRSGSADPGRRTGTKAGRPTPGPYALQARGPGPRPGRLVRPRPPTRRPGPAVLIGPGSSVEPVLNMVHVGVGSASSSSPLVSAGTWPTQWGYEYTSVSCDGAHWSRTPCASPTSIATRATSGRSPTATRYPEERSAPARRRIDEASVVGDNWMCSAVPLTRRRLRSHGQPVSPPTSCDAVRSTEEMRSGMAPLH